MIAQSDQRTFVREARFLLEEVLWTLLRMHHIKEGGTRPEDIRINQEIPVGVPGLFADFRIAVPERPPYFLEIKYGYPSERIVRNVGRKFGVDTPGTQGAEKLIVLVDQSSRPDWEILGKELQGRLRRGLELEVWNEERLYAEIRKHFEIEIDSLTNPESLYGLRAGMDHAQGRYAFGASYADDPLHASLLWHLSFWRLHALCRQGGLAATEVLAPNIHPEAVAIFADLSSFSSYVRDTRDDRTVRYVLSSFYLKARNHVLNTGGMLYQLPGDGVIALFGIPTRDGRYQSLALECARGLLDIGASVSREWQRLIDHVQTSAGCHIGIAMGDLSMLSQRPFSRDQIACIADCVNMSARLSTAAACDEIVVSNAFLQKLRDEEQELFVESEPVEARNIGRIRAWKFHRN